MQSVLKLAKHIYLIFLTLYSKHMKTTVNKREKYTKVNLFVKISSSKSFSYYANYKLPIKITFVMI